jgi:hypothetical protein
MMKKIITLIAIGLFTINATAQDGKKVVKKEAKKESCCSAKADDHKAMTADAVAKCKAKCKAEGKKCDAKIVATEEKKCCAKKA